ncbi:MAG: hypothetical protein J6V95_02645 [Bacteroidaceae bacterium]|nr:hypothetical protein [Bacteroidaceae bacterium]MBP5348662.1 hypothetical protein [Bacteroidaceae bacterium]MBR4594480.1 hypothetical protein [Bacteroidaceae bacterium]
MYNIQANESGTRSINVSDENLETLRSFSLLQFLVDSNGIITEQSLDKLKLTIRSLLTTPQGSDKKLLDLCIDVIYHRDMKAFGLKNLIALYNQWNAANPEQAPAE